MVKIRLRRVGAKKQPSYRVVVADSQSPRDGRFIEIIGFYNPRTEPETVRIKEERALHWLSVGAQPTDAVRRLLEKQGTLARFARLKAGEPLEDLVTEADAQLPPAPEPEPQPEPQPEPVAAEAEGETVEEVPEAVEETAAAAATTDQGEEQTEA